MIRSAKKIADKYAKAIFLVAKTKKEKGDISSGLASLVAVVNKEESISRVFNSSVFPKVTVVNIVKEISKKSGFGKNLTSFLALLAENRRLYLIENIAESFDDLIIQEAGSKKVEITSSVELTKENISEISKKLESKLGKDLEVSTKIDENILGGFIVKSGSVMLDCSVLGKLTSANINTKAAIAASNID